jgi:hypothetical protein
LRKLVMLGVDSRALAQKAREVFHVVTGEQGLGLLASPAPAARTFGRRRWRRYGPDQFLWRVRRQPARYVKPPSKANRIVGLQNQYVGLQNQPAPHAAFPNTSSGLRNQAQSEFGRFLLCAFPGCLAQLWRSQR